MGNWSPRVFTWGFCHLPPHPPPHPPLPLLQPAHPLVTLAKIDAHLQKNRLKRPEIKQGRTSKVNCILFNRLLSKVLLNKSGLVRAKAGSFTLKTLNTCFSNYYQVRTWPVFAWRVTYIKNTYFICSLATWGKCKGNTQSINLLLPFKI